MENKVGRERGRREHSVCTSTHAHSHKELTFEAYRRMTYFFKTVTNKNQAGVMGRQSEVVCDRRP